MAASRTSPIADDFFTAAQATAERLYPQEATVRQTAEMLRNASGAAP